MNSLNFTPYAWSKLRYLQAKGNTEVSFFAVSNKDRLNLVVDLFMPKQQGGYATTDFIDEHLPAFFERMVDRGFHPEEFGRIWCHTHPMDSASPSCKDEKTFKDELDGPNWAIMFIVGKSGATTCRLKLKPHPDLAHIVTEASTKELPVHIAYDVCYPAVSEDVYKTWDTEYEENLVKESYSGYSGDRTSSCQAQFGFGLGSSYKPTPKFRPGPGYRKNVNGNWVYRTSWMEEDNNCGILNEDDYERRYGSEGYPEGSDDKGYMSSCYYSLTKREKKYLKRHGTLQGYKSPSNPGYKIREVPEEATDLDTFSDEEWINQVCKEWDENQRKLDMESPQAKLWTVVLSNGTRCYNIKSCSSSAAMDYVDEGLYFSLTTKEVPDVYAYYAIPQERTYKEELYTVTLTNGEKITGIPAFDEHDAIQRVHAKLKLDPYFPREEEDKYVLVSGKEQGDTQSSELSSTGACDSDLDETVITL